MKTINALPIIIKVLGFDWTDQLKFMLAVGFQMKLAGIDYRTNDELAIIMTILTQMKFVEVDFDKGVARINPVFKQ